MPTTSPGRYAGEDNGWVGGIASEVMLDFDQSMIKYPNIKRLPGGASNDLVPNLQNPANPVRHSTRSNLPKIGAQGG